MIFLYTIYSNIQQYALIDVQLNEKNPGYWQKYPETQTTPKKPRSSGKKPSCGNTARHRSEEMGRNLNSKSIKNSYNIFTKSFFSCSP